MFRPNVRFAMLATAIIAPLIAVVPAGGSAAATSPSASSTIVALDAIGHLTLTSSTGKHLYLEVESYRDNFAGEDPTSYAEITLSDSLGEAHGWSDFDVSNTALRHTGSGHGTLRISKKDFGNIGSINLTFRPDGRSTSKTCRPETTRELQPVTVVGTVTLNTQSVWGRVDATSHTFTFSRKSQLEIDDGEHAGACQGGGSSNPKPCSGNISWNDAGGVLGSFQGDSEGSQKRANISFFRSDFLRGGTEQDTFDFATMRQPTLTTTPSGAKRLVIHAGHHGLITGTAILTTTGAPTLKKNPKCQGSSRSWTATYAQGSRPLTVHDDIGGTFTQRNQKKAGLTIDPSH